MKFLNLLLLASIATLICACEKNFQSEMLSEGQQTSQTHVQPGILSFSSIEEMENQIRALIEMESDDREAWYAKRNFESQYDALYRAAEEIDRAATLSDAEAIKEKYREFFLYNDNPEDEELFNPYLPNEKSSYAYVCNIRGEVQIGNEIHNFNTITDVRNTKEFQRFHEVETRGVETHSNYLKSTVGKSKFWAEGRLDGNEVVAIEFTAHKKVRRHCQMQRLSRKSTASFFFTMIIRKMRSCLILTCLMKNRAMPMSAIFVEKYKSVMRSIISIRLRMSEIPKNSSGFMKLKHEA